MCFAYLRQPLLHCRPSGDRCPEPRLLGEQPPERVQAANLRAATFTHDALSFWEVRWHAWWRGPRCIRVLAGVGLSWCNSGLPLLHLDSPICAWIREPWPLMSHRGTHLPSRPLVAVPLDVSSAGFAFRFVSVVLSAVVVPPLYLFFLTPPLDSVWPGLVHQSMDRGARVF